MCPNAISPSMCCSSNSGTCSSSKAHTTIIDIHTMTKAHQNEETSAFLQSLTSHLDILTAGSLFLLPSILPFLASALTADSYSSPSSSSSSTSAFAPGSYVSPTPPLYADQAPSVPLVSGTTATALESSVWSWNTMWIMLLPCLGVVAPLSLFKIMTLLEEHGIQCPYTRWRHGRRAVAGRRHRRVRRLMKQSNCRHGAADGPTFKAMKRVWRNLVGTNSDDFLGYAPLPMAYQDDEVSAEEGLCVGEKDMHQTPKVDFAIKSHRRSQVSSSALPRPKTILLASLWAWTLLMTFSAKMGFNSLEQISVPTSPVVSSNVIEGGVGAPIFILPPTTPADLLSPQVEDGQIDLRMWEPTSDLWSAEQQQQQEEQAVDGMDAIVSMLDMDLDGQFDAIEALWAEDQSTTDSNEEPQPFARIQTSIVISNNYNNNDDDAAATPLTEQSPFTNMMEEETDEDIEDMSSLDAMIMDPRDEAVFHDFLHQLDQEDATVRAAAEESQGQDQQRLSKLFRATDDLMVASMLDSDLPCGYYRPSTPSWFSGIQKFLVGDSLSAADIGVHFPGRTFIYTGWSTDLMILAVAMCLGGVLVGLAQSKVLYYQLLDRHISLSGASTTIQRRRASWATLLASLALSVSALALAFLMIADESWDVPSIYFVGIGIAGIILVHAWVPNAALTVHKRDDSTDEDSLDDDNDTCVGSDTELDSNNKILDETPLVWSPPTTERRNACSLDENHRWEVIAAATFHETVCYTR
ncbi:hypothetical protein K457DRAFT_137662 [Linnemannia elongata AG-77]|uniref:Transmembrane protein n=1 Tax=Linnemannia elongata AG-77 TaxID=1314771 RepID=A0A197JZB3_9FUNG|nr:hypothetical protein K457DRAFT_137662 [Linnemannia elongata AG-77]